MKLGWAFGAAVAIIIAIAAKNLLARLENLK